MQDIINSYLLHSSYSSDEVKIILDIPTQDDIDNIQVWIDSIALKAMQENRVNIFSHLSLRSITRRPTSYNSDYSIHYELVYRYKCIENKKSL